MKKYINHLSELADLKLFFVRYFVNFILLVEILLVPILVNPNVYTSLEWIKNVVMFIPVALLGLHSGFINVYYGKAKDYRKGALLAGFLISVVSALAFFFATSSWVLALAVFSFLLIIISEKILIVDGHLLLASVYKSFHSIALLALIVFYDSYAQNNIEAVYGYSILIGTSIWFLCILFLYRKIIAHLMEAYSKYKISVFARAFELFQRSAELIRAGFLISAQTFLLIGFFLFDRWVILNYFPSMAASYSIAFSLCQISFIALNTIAFSFQKSLGEKVHEIRLVELKRLLAINGLFFIFLFVSSSVFVYIVSEMNIFSGYGDYFFTYIILNFFYGLYYFFASYAVIAIYKGFSKLLLVLMLMAFVLDVLLTGLLVELGYDFILWKSGLILMLVSLIGLLKVMQVVK